MSSIQDIKIPEGWQNLPIIKCLEYEQPNKYIVRSDKYSDINKIPVLTANKAFILGYTNEEDGLYDKGPVIVFDDFTMDMKYADFPFKVKSSAIKFLTPINGNNIRYMYSILQFLNLEPETHKRNYISEVQCMDIIVPKDLKEQEKIAEILTTIDEDIEKTDKLIEKYKKIKAGLMEDLFTKGIDVTTGKPHTKFKDSELGEIPESWKIKLVFMVTDYVDYRGKTPEKVEEGRFLVTARNIKGGIIDYNLSQEFIKESDYDIVMSRGLPKIGDVLFTTEAPMGEVANVDNEKIALAQRIIKFRGKNNKLNNYFLKYSFVSHYFVKLLKNESAGSTVEGIKGSRLHNLSLKIPEMKEQEKIVEILVEADNKINKEEEYKEKLVKMKKGLMNDLLTGKVRVRF